jgi:hypothetical protein
MRVGDAERHSAVTALGVHLANGRLKPAEHEKRCVLADIALTRGELAALFADLPEPHPDLPGPAGVRTGGSSKGFQFAVGFALIIALPTAVMQMMYLGGWWMFAVVAAILLVATAAEVTRRQRV